MENLETAVPSTRIVGAPAHIAEQVASQDLANAMQILPNLARLLLLLNRRI